MRGRPGDVPGGSGGRQGDRGRVVESQLWRRVCKSLVLWLLLRRSLQGEKLSLLVILSSLTPLRCWWRTCTTWPLTARWWCCSAWCVSSTARGWQSFPRSQRLSLMDKSSPFSSTGGINYSCSTNWHLIFHPGTFWSGREVRRRPPVGSTDTKRVSPSWGRWQRFWSTSVLSANGTWSWYHAGSLELMEMTVKRLNWRWSKKGVKVQTKLVSVAFFKVMLSTLHIISKCDFTLWSENSKFRTDSQKDNSLLKPSLILIWNLKSYKYLII